MADKQVNSSPPVPSAAPPPVVLPAAVPPPDPVVAAPPSVIQHTELATLLRIQSLLAVYEPLLLLDEDAYDFESDEDEDAPLPVPIPPPVIDDGVPVDPTEDDDYLLQVGDKFLVCNNKIFDSCPKVRRCPQCSVLIEHISNCRWMTCHCTFEFCFVCGTNTCIKTFHYESCPNGYSKAL